MRKIACLFLVIILFGCGAGKENIRTDTESVPDPLAGDKITDIIADAELILCYVPSGTFTLGLNEDEIIARPAPRKAAKQKQDRLDPVNISITKGYWIAETEITQELWQSVMTGTDNNNNPSSFNETDGKASAGGKILSNHPVESITWYDAIEFCNRLSELNEKEKVYTLIVKERQNENGRKSATGSITKAEVSADFNKNGYRLPTEMEWMWAAMGASDLPDAYKKEFAGDLDPQTKDGEIETYAWYTKNSDYNTHEVKTKSPNELGLYDMSGNVSEWCWDRIGGSWPLYDSEISNNTADYQGSDSGSYRVPRGGNWNDSAALCTVAARGRCQPFYRYGTIGFRIVRNAD